MSIPIAISNRHIHLCKKDLELLFGIDFELENLRNLSQPGEFASKQTVNLIGPKGKIERVRILGPIRNNTQVEISIGDSFQLGIKAPIRMSGDVNGSASLILEGLKGTIELKQGIIIAKRHIHMTVLDANKFGVSDGDVVKVKTQGERGLIFDNVIIRVSDNYKLEMHIDVEEANAAGICNGDLGSISI